MKKLAWWLVLLLLAGVFVPGGVPASAHHRSDPNLRAYVEGFCYIPKPGRVILSAVAIIRRFIEREETRDESLVSIAFYADKNGGPEKYNLLNGLVKRWHANLDQPPHWESYQFGRETGGRDMDRLDGLRLGISVGWGDSLVTPHGHHGYPAVAQWTRDEGCSTYHAGSIEQP